MTDESALTCPQCQQGQLSDKGDGTLECAQCGARFVAPQRVCPYCDTVNEVDAKTCSGCDKPLRRTCPRCGTINWIGARQCASCDQRFDTIGLIAAREELRFVDRFTHRARGITDLKASEHAQSQQRMDQFWDEDRRRRATLAAQQAKQKQQEMRLMYVAIAFMVIVIIGIIVISLLAGRG